MDDEMISDAVPILSDEQRRAMDQQSAWLWSSGFNAGKRDTIMVLMTGSCALVVVSGLLAGFVVAVMHWL